MKASKLFWSPEPESQGRRMRLALTAMCPSCPKLQPKPNENSGRYGMFQSTAKCVLKNMPLS